MLLAAVLQFEFALRPDGWVHLVLPDHGNILRGPVGVLGYLLFVPLIWAVPRRAVPAFLIVSSTVWALLTVGPAYVGWLAVAAAWGWGAMWLARPDRRGFVAAALMLATGYGLLLVWPQPFPLPPVAAPLPRHFYLHWAGLAYIGLKLYHLARDVHLGRMARPSGPDYLAYLLFAPTLRMGPLYRAEDFLAQLHERPARFEPRCLGPTGLRMLAGVVRFGVLVLLVEHFPPEAIFTRPDQLARWQVLGALYAQPMAFYLWISAYTDVAVAAGRLMGFRVPDNFHYPWIAANIAEFWRRWHIPLREWLGDYIFTPLIRRRWHFVAAYLATFLFAGAWHGLYAGMLIWGCSQGLGMAVWRYWSQFWKRRKRAAGPGYAALRRWRLVDSRLNRVLAWALLFHYQMLTIVIATDEHHAGIRLLMTIVGASWTG